MMRGIIYIVRPPDADRVVYVGQTRKSLRVRVNVHRQNVRAGQTSPFCCYLRDLTARGEWARFEVLEECDLEMLDEREAHWIQHFKDQGLELLNVTRGGRDSSMYYPHVVEKVRSKLLGRKLSPEHCAKIGDLKRGKPSPRRGSKMPVLQKELLSVRVSSLWQDPDYRARQTESRKRIWSDPAHRTRMSAAHQGKTLSAEQRAKIAAAHTGTTRSEETRARMRAAWRRRKGLPE